MLFELMGVAAIKGFLRTPGTDNSVILLPSRKAHFCLGYARSEALQPVDSPNDAMPLTYVLIRILRACRCAITQERG
jgi:hypothetical protein